jgi:pimeloyl-ACP methyl ester carboxylesterase
MPHPKPTPPTPQFRLKFLALAALCLALLAAIGSPFIHAHLQSAALLDLILGDKPSWLMLHTITDPVTEQNLQFSTPSGLVQARLYTPVDHPNAPGLVIYHGVHHYGIDEPHLVAFARVLSACGLRVLTPELPGIRDYLIDPSAITQIGDSTQWFSRRTGAPVGVMGISFSGGLALMAAAQPAYAPSFHFVVTVGSHDSLSRVADFYRTGRALRPDGSVQQLPPHEYGALVIEYQHLDGSVSPADAPAIHNVLQAHLTEDHAAEHLALLRLNPTQHEQALELMDAHSDRTLSLLQNSVVLHAAEMNAVSPAGKLRHLTIPVYLLHGQADNIIPSPETQWLATEIPPSELRLMLVSPVISHIGIEDGSALGVLTRWRNEYQLIHFFACVLHTAERTHFLTLR